MKAKIFFISLLAFFGFSMNTIAGGESDNGWTVVDYSDTAAGDGAPSYVIDGNTSTFWHNDWKNNVAYPHSITLMHDGEITIDKISFNFRQNGADGYIPRNVVVFISNDDDHWTPAGLFDFASTYNQTIQFDSPITTTYIKFIFRQGYDRFLAINEIMFNPSNVDGETIIHNSMIYNDTSEIIQFSDSKIKTLCVDAWDLNLDGELSVQEAQQVEHIDIFQGRNDITSFDEIVYFTGASSVNFSSCKNLASINIPDGVTSIGDYAFSGCSNLTSINIQEGVTFIGAGAFKNCSNLTSINIQEGVTFIGAGAFKNCSSLTSINIPNGVTSIREEAFSGCSSLTSINIPNGVTSIGNYAFSGCSSLTSINIPNGVTSIGNYAFSGCSSLTSINIPNGVTSIGDYAFSGCSNLTSINIQEGVRSIGAGAFKNCSSLASINIPNGVTSIREEAFSGCSSLTSITIPDGVTSIGNGAFYNCSSLTSINIPEGVTSIGNGAFYNCSSLTSIKIPEGVASIGGSAFWSCSSLTSINIPNGVTSIGNYAFSGCSSLTSINIPEGVTSIGDGAFSSCTYIHFASTTPRVSCNWNNNSHPVLVVPDEAVEAYKTAWPEYAAQIIPEAPDDYVYDINVTAMDDFPDVIAKIGEENALKVVKLKVTGTINSYDVMAFRNKMLNLHYLDLSDATIVASSYTYFDNRYKTKDNVITGFFGAPYLTSITLPNNITSLDANAFSGCNYLTSITIPENVTAIGNSAFYNCGRIQSVTLPSSLISIGEAAFEGCENISTIVFPESINSIGNYAFKRCSRLTAIDLSNSNITSIGNNAFESCTSLTKIDLSESSITSIGNNAFESCTRLTTIDLSESNLTTIGIYAFYNCNSLTSIDLPKGLKTIGGSAFSGCSNLTQVKLPPYLESMGNFAFSGCSKLNTIYVYIPDYTLDVNESAFSTYTTAELRIPRFLYYDYYLNQGGWKRFINMVPCDLQPGDYEVLPTNSDTSISGNDEIIPKIDEDTPIDGDINNEGSITVTDDVTDTQEFDNVDQNIDGEGHGGSLIGENDGEDGNLSVNQLRVNIHVKPGRWYFFIFPYDVTIENVEYPGQYAWLYYDAAHRALTGQTGWKAVEGETLQALHGYAFQTGKQGTMVVTFNKPNFGGDPLLNLVAHAAENIQHASWNLVGNPHSSFYEFLEDAFSAPITRWNPSTGTYTAYRPGDDDIHLQPYEAFFVQKPGNMDHIKFKDVCRESYRKSEEKKANHIAARRAKGIDPQRRLINLEILSGEEQMDQTRVVLNNEKSHAYELDCDAAKMMSGEAKAQLYSIENGINMAINERPQDGDIRLGYTAKTAGTLSISAQRMDLPMMLIDTQLGVTFDLSLGTYDFDTAAGTFDGRFLLRPSGEATAINSLTAKTGVCIGTQDGGIAIGGAEGKTISVYTVSGAQVAAHDGNGFIALKSGVYVVSVDGVSAKVSVK